MKNFRTAGLLISLGVAGLLAGAACGSSGGTSSGATTAASVPAGAVVIEALDIKFDKKAYDATAGKVTIVYENKGQLVHTLLVLDESNTQIGPTLRVDPGQTKTETFDLPAGTHQLICDVPGHAAAGMKATITVD
jgi:uncharacterized cupredoxin-like copper-binding protein